MRGVFIDNTQLCEHGTSAKDLIYGVKSCMPDNLSYPIALNHALSDSWGRSLRLTFMSP